jgi:predicted GIY-YIG superfamily endonuclease
MHPTTNNIFYVGETANIKRRFTEHLCRLERNENKWAEVQSIKSQGLKTILVIFETGILTKDEAYNKEVQYIAQCKFQGHKLTNMNDGGHSQPPSTRGKKLNHGHKILASTPLKKTVYQYDKDLNLINQYISVREAGRQTGIDHRSISEVANKSNPSRHRAGGYFWDYNIKEKIK